ncbi:hypothetical protein GBF38_022159 [Nibea albiflora]|uniref:Uncharacterized protein n=1 Tax=Nibea albiflora TaxID=240163 RepID=A0ACB7FIJ5_NIBAL|nr:hypothetical protein GBF38_022159 [Nibea albiflora]
MGLRSSKLRDQHTEGCDLEGDLSDEEEEVYYLEGPPESVTWGPYVQEIGSTPLRQPPIPLNPHAPEFNTEKSTESECPSHDLSAEPLELEVEMSRDMGQHLGESGGDVIIDIPECDILNSSLAREGNTGSSSVHMGGGPSLPNQENGLVSEEHEEDVNTVLGSGPNEPRHSNRERHPPRKLSYDELGTPLILALSLPSGVIFLIHLVTCL